MDSIQMKIFEHYLLEIEKNFGFTLEDLRKKNKKTQISVARQILMYVLKVRFEKFFSYSKIGDLLHRNHSTVIHGVEIVIRALKYKEPRFLAYEKFSHLEKETIFEIESKNQKIPGLKLKVFKEIVSQVRLQSDNISLAYKSGIDLINFFDPSSSAISHLIGGIYGKDGLDTFNWWCYDKNWGQRTDLKMTDKNGQEICRTVEELHSWLEENKDDDYDLPHKMSDVERINFLENIF